MRSYGIFERMAVGANGGSFTVGNWDNITIPNFPVGFMNSLIAIYNSDSELFPAFFDETKIYELGIYQLNDFLIKCKA